MYYVEWYIYILYNIIYNIIYIYIYIEQDKNSMMSWSTNFIITIITIKIFDDPVAFLCGTMLTDKTTTN